MRDHFPSLRGVFGSWVFYPALGTLEQVARLIVSSQDIRESDDLDDYLQRDLTTNVGKIVSYLRERDDRFLNSIIVGIFNGVPEWSTFDLSALDHIGEKRSEIEDSIGILTLRGNEKLFAVDGQHRVEALRRVSAMGENANDQVPLIFVSHIDTVKGKRRTRRLFSDINKKAQRVSKGELAIIDEEEIENIVARRIYSYLERREDSIVAVTKTRNVRSNDEYFVNLLTMVKVASILAQSLGLRKATNPSEDDIKRLYNLTKRFFDLVIDEVPAVGDAVEAASYRVLREEDLIILFRPIGIEIMANVFTRCLKEQKIGRLREKISKIDFSLESRYFQDVIYVRNRVEVKYAQTSCDLILYALGVIRTRQEIKVPDGFEDDFLKGRLNRIK